MSFITVVGLGPGGDGAVTAETFAAIERIGLRFLRTARHPSAHLVADATTFDDVYEAADRFDDVYAEIVERLVTAAAEHGEVLYAVPGSPLVLERSVRLLRRRRACGGRRAPGDVVPRRRLGPAGHRPGRGAAYASSTATISPAPPPASTGRC